MPFFQELVLRLAGAGASALSLHRGHLSREPSEVNRSASISLLISCMYLYPFLRKPLVLVTRLQGLPRAKMMADSSAELERAAFTGNVVVKSWR